MSFRVRSVLGISEGYTGMRSMGLTASDLLPPVKPHPDRIPPPLLPSLPMQLDLMLAYESFIDGQSNLLYPINILRNYARLQVRMVDSTIWQTRFDS